MLLEYKQSILIALHSLLASFLATTTKINDDEIIVLDGQSILGDCSVTVALFLKILNSTTVADKDAQRNNCCYE